MTLRQVKDQDLTKTDKTPCMCIVRFATAFLARFSATVLKIDPPGWHSGERVGLMTW